MSRFRLISLGLLAILTLGAVVLAPAGAEEPKKCGVPSPTHWAYCYGSTNDEMGKPSARAAEGTGGVAVMTGMVDGVSATFECEKSELGAEFESGGKGGGNVSLKKCKETAPAHCRLSPTEETEIQMYFAASFNGTVEKGKAVQLIFAGTGSEEEIYDMDIEDETSACQIGTGAYRITGKQTVELAKPEEAAVEHELVIKKSGSNFKIGGNSVSMSDTFKVKLKTPHESWYVGVGN